MKNKISVTLLGTGCPTLDKERFGPSTLIKYKEKKILFDCGSGVTQRLTQIEEKVADIDAIFITHMHSDHIVDLYQVFISGWHQGREFPLVIYGPLGIKKFIQQTQSMWLKEQKIRKSWEKRSNNNGLAWDVKEIDNSETINFEGLVINPFIVDHFPIEPAFGYKIATEEKKIVISGDTGPSNNLIKNSMESDLLIHELFTEEYKDTGGVTSVYQKTPAAYHTTPVQVGMIASKSKTKHLLLTHFVPPEFDKDSALKDIQENYKGQITFGYDLYNIDI